MWFIHICSHSYSFISCKSFKNHQKHVFENLFCLVADLFNLAGDGDGVGVGWGGGTILGPPMPNKCLFRLKISFLEIAHTNFVSSIRITPYQLLIWTWNIKNMFCKHLKLFETSKTVVLFQFSYFVSFIYYTFYIFIHLVFLYIFEVHTA